MSQIPPNLLQTLLTEIRADPEILGFLATEYPGLQEAVEQEIDAIQHPPAPDPWRNGLARPTQLLPGTKGSFSTRNDWRVWLLMGGRGSGKSRAGAEAVRELLLGTDWNEPPRCALVSTTLDAVRIDMVEGQLFKVFGGMASEGKGGRITQFNRSSVEMWLDNGAYLKGYSSEWPSRLRGPNFHLAWCFPAGTPVTMADGSDRPIERVRRGDRVASDTADGIVEWSGMTRRDAPVWRLGHNGGNLDATPDHPVWVVGSGWVRLDSVKPGDKLQPCPNMARHRRSSVRRNAGTGTGTATTSAENGYDDDLICVTGAFPMRTADVYDLTVSTSEFYAAGVRVHNCDEPAAWLDAYKAPSEDSTWSNMEFAVRMDDEGRWEPRIIATTTPKPVRLLRIRNQEDEHYPGVFDDPDTVISSMRTLDNVSNLAETFRKRVVGRYDGTRLGAQELEGKLLDVAEGALWTPEALSQMRIPLHKMLEPYSRGTTVIAVDPSTGDGSGDECGIVVASRRLGDMGYNSDQIAILDDASIRGRPSEWATKVAEKYEEWNCDYVVAEINQGGQLVREVLGRYSQNLPIRDVFAKRGKHLRAEPVALLSDQGQIKLAGSFPLLEDQMATFEPDKSQKSPDRLDALVYAVLWLMPAKQVSLNLVSRRTSGTVKYRK